MGSKYVAPSKLRLLYDDAVAAVQEQRYDEAIGQFRRILQFMAEADLPGDTPLPPGGDQCESGAPRSLVAACRTDLGNCYAHKGMFAEAAAEFEKAVALEPWDWQTACALGRLYERQGDPTAAIQHLQAAVEATPTCAEAYGALARCHVDAGNLDAAIEASHAALALDPDTASARASLILALKERGQSAEALEAFWEAPSLPGDDAVFLYEAADLLGGAGETAAAAKVLEQALTADPQFEAAIQALAEVYLVLGEPEKALETAARSGEQGAGRIPILDVMVIAAERLGDVEAALLRATELVELAPLDAYAHFRLAMVLQRCGDYANAMSRYGLAMDLARGDEHILEPAEEAIETLDSIQLHQIVALAASSLVFRANLKRDPENTLEQHRFRLTDGALAMLVSLDLDELPSVAGHIDHRMPH